MSDIPVVVTQAGAIPTPPADLLAKLLTNVAARVPGYTANLPPGLITDLAGTATGAVALLDSAMVDAINSVTPYGVNVPLLLQLGNIYGIPQGKGSNTSVYLTFIGPPGFVIPKGFTVSDGNHQYVIQTNTVIPTGGQTNPTYALANQSGTWAVPAGSVTQIITSVPADIELTCTNTSAGLPGEASQSEWDYRSQVMQAGMFAVQGTPDCVKAALRKVKGVKNNLISFRQISTEKWVMIVGGGDPYEVANAIYQSIPDISVLTADVADADGNTPDSATITIIDSPDSYAIPYVIPTSQITNAVITWNTTASTFINPATVATLVRVPVAAYINSIPVGQPINIYEIQCIVLKAMSALVDPSLVSLIDVEIVINGTVVPPKPNTDLVYGSEYGYFTTTLSSIVVQQYGVTS